MQKSTKALVIELLESMVTFTDDSNPSKRAGLPDEVQCHLEDLLPDRLANVLFLGEEGEDELVRRYGIGGATIPQEFRALCGVLKRLKTTGQVKQDELVRGGWVLSTLIAATCEEENEARKGLNPDDPGVQLGVRIDVEGGGWQRDEALSEVLRIHYGRYLDLNCARAALERLRDGVLQIRQSLGKGSTPPLGP